VVKMLPLMTLVGSMLIVTIDEARAAHVHRLESRKNVMGLVNPRSMVPPANAIRSISIVTEGANDGHRIAR